MKRLALLSILIVSAHLTAFSQQAANATLTGGITDPNGALIPGAKVTATQTTTSIKREVVTNEDGLYVFSNLTPGDYELKVEARGFATHITKTPVPVKVGQTVTLNIPLEIKAGEEIICRLVV